jgi:transposase
MTKEAALERPIVPEAREGRRRAFSERDKQRILGEAARPGANLSAVARSYGIATRVVFRWKQELIAAAPVFVSVEIAGPGSPAEEHAPCPMAIPSAASTISCHGTGRRSKLRPDTPCQEWTLTFSDLTMT